MDVSYFNQHRVYWSLQLGGWFFYILTAFIFSQFRGYPVNISLVLPLALAYVLGVSISHTYREIILKLDWLRFNIIGLIPRILGATLFFSLVFELVYFGTTYTLFFRGQAIDWIGVVQEYLGWEILILLWSMFYFVFHIFKNYKNEEIKNLRWEASKNEIELNKLKSQLNPHFIFNAMNSIRALVDENPKKSKQVITQLSNVLRNNLLMGRKKVTNLQEEISMVKDYLEIESARFEERLRYNIDIEDDCLTLMVPPMMVQTLVENGIKHGISKLPKGGELKVTAKKEDGLLNVEILNTGKYLKSKKPETGFGIENTKERLRLLFGREDLFAINNFGDNQVKTTLTIPQNLTIS
tara:strand:+ start:510 stop:1568 length:1059 start_codon:yes stop_codon:yes gene_type:complete